MNVSLMPTLMKKAPVGVTRFIGRKQLVLKKNAPHIFFVGGVIGTVTSTVLACRATLKLSDTLDEIQTDINAINELKKDKENTEHPGRYPTEELDRDKAYVYTQAVLKIGRLYGPAIGLGVVSIGALTGSHIDLTRRNTAIMAAYGTLQTAYDNYRERVVAELGEDRELDIYHAKEDEVQQEGSTDVVPVVNPGKWSPYARFFDEASTSWEKNAEYNRLFLTNQQNYINDLLYARGHVFLNEVYDRLGFERTKEGAVVGWLREGDGDGYIDFGMYEATNEPFINGWEPRVILDFNVDGVIWDKI